MQFYKAEGRIVNEGWDEEQDGRQRRHNKNQYKIHETTYLFNQKLKNEAFICMAEAEVYNAAAVILARKSNSPETIIKDYLEALELKLGDIRVTEITLREAKQMLSRADRNDYINDDDEVLRVFELDELGGWRSGIEYEEYMLEPEEKTAVYKRAASVLSEKTLIPELDRIYMGAKKEPVQGHPIHYMVLSDDQDMMKEMPELLLEALYDKKRIQSRRYVTVEQPRGMYGDKISPRMLELLFKSCIGGSLLIRFQPNDDREDVFASADLETIRLYSTAIKKYRSQVLIVLCLPRNCTKTKNRFYECLGCVSMIEISEDLATNRRAHAYLKDRATGERLEPDRKLYANLKKDGAYLASELNRFFDEWFAAKLRSSYYPQYRSFAPAVSVSVKKNAEGNAFDELNEMIGLNSAKKVIEEALAYYKAQRIYAEKGIKFGRVAMHMVFTGNPGTAKTTTARLFARIMRDNGLLSKGHLVEVGRSDLVGRYVGWTAPTVKEKFKAAKGGVLFIDEAYSLVDDRDGLYGDEAINTIVQEMENHRDDMVVIFAGYPDKMQGFLDKNPGLRSRIAFHVPFEDYTAEELCEITRLHAGRKKIELTDEAMKKLSGIYASVLDQKDFGNGRFVRNVLEKAQMAQAKRLLTMDPETVTERDVRTIEAADIEEPPMNRQRDEKRKIGF